MSDELWIWMDGRRVGTLTAQGNHRRALSVVYDADWAAGATATPLSVSMPLAAEEHSGQALEAWLWGLLPDNDAVVRRWASQHHVSERDVFGLLRSVGADVAGAAQWLPPGVDPAETGAVQWLSESDVAELLVHLRTDAAGWHPAIGGRWSLAGAQSKVALAWLRRADGVFSWAVPGGSVPTTHILKPAIVGLDHHDINEHLCLQAANQLGLRAAASTVRYFENEPALVVTRYDRHQTETGWVRVHQEDVCQALGVHPIRKYESEGGPGFAQMLDLVRSSVSPQAQVETAERLASAAAFNWLILAPDAHAKNYSLLLSGTQVRLAPLYDLSSAVLSGLHPTEVKLAQKLGGDYRATVVGRRHLERAAKTAGIGSEEFVAHVVSMGERLPDALADAARAPEMDDGARDAASRLVDGVAKWVNGCLMRLRAAGDRPHDDRTPPESN